MNVIRNCKVIVFLFLCLFSFFVISRVALNYSGYCYKEGRYFSDKEKIDLAVMYIVNTYPPVVDIYERSSKEDSVGRSSPKNSIKYSSVEQFYRDNKDCCSVSKTGKKGTDVPLTHKLIGSVDKYVKIKYKVRYKDSNDNVIEVFETPFVAVSNCGHTWSGI
jgi:hypothetical protein